MVPRGSAGLKKMILKTISKVFQKRQEKEFEIIQWSSLDKHIEIGKFERIFNDILKWFQKIIKQILKWPYEGIRIKIAIKFNFNVVDIMQSHF